MKVRIAKIEHGSLVDGPGVRTAVWFAGCPICCPGCYNSHLWPADSGQETTVEGVLAAIKGGRDLGDRGVTLVGGEPLAQPKAAAALCLALRRLNIHTIVYTGFVLEDILGMAAVIPEYWTILLSADVLVDGPYIGSEADPDCQYRGSRNQRVFDLRRAFGAILVQSSCNPRAILADAEGGCRGRMQRANAEGEILVKSSRMQRANAEGDGSVTTLDQEWDDQHLVTVAPDGVIHFSAAVLPVGLALEGRVQPACNCGEILVQSSRMQRADAEGEILVKSSCNPRGCRGRMQRANAEGECRG